MNRPPFLAPELEQRLRRSYLHHSADWSVSGDGVHASALFYINRPTDDGKRVVLPNEDNA